MYVIYDNLTHEFISFREAQRARSPPRKQRVKRAIKYQYYEDLRKLLGIVTIDEHATECADCNVTFTRTSLFPKALYSFACQLCNKTCCSDCKRNLQIMHETTKEPILGAITCKSCNDYVRNLRSSVAQEPADGDFTSLTEAFQKILKIYEHINNNLLQLQGYIRLCAIHQQLGVSDITTSIASTNAPTNDIYWILAQEPLPGGTTTKINCLLEDVITQRKLIAEVKNTALDHSLEHLHQGHICIGIKRSLIALSKGILYQSIPKINEVIYNLTSLGQYKSS